jgi:hypothetical protein
MAIRKRGEEVKERKIGKSSSAAIQKEIDEIGKVYSKFKGIIKDGVKVYGSRDDENSMRFMPPLVDGEFFGTIVWVHFDIGINEDRFICLDRSLGERCLICEHQSKLRSEGADKDDIKKFYPTKRYLFNVVDMFNAESKEEGVQIFDCPQTVGENMLLVTKDEDTKEPIDISDVENGFTFFFTKTGKGKTGTKYSGYRIARRSTPLESPDWLDQIVDVNDVINLPEDEEVLKALDTSVEQQPQETDDTPDKSADTASEEVVTRRGGKGGSDDAENDKLNDAKAKLRAKLKKLRDGQ